MNNAAQQQKTQFSAWAPKCETRWKITNQPYVNFCHKPNVSFKSATNEFSVFAIVAVVVPCVDSIGEFNRKALCMLRACVRGGLDMRHYWNAEPAATAATAFSFQEGALWWRVPNHCLYSQKKEGKKIWCVYHSNAHQPALNECFSAFGVGFVVDFFPLPFKRQSGERYDNASDNCTNNRRMARNANKSRNALLSICFYWSVMCWMLIAYRYFT